MTTTVWRNTDLSLKGEKRDGFEVQFRYNIT